MGTKSIPISEIYNLYNKEQELYDNTVNILKNNKHIKKYYKDKNEIYEKYVIKDETKFCIFEVISDKYFRETFHSDIIAMLLDPDTREIGDIHFFVYFLKYLGLLEEDFDVEKDAGKYDVVVHKEEFTGAINGKKGYMDITCYYKDNPESNEYDKAILIENKINYAPDMEDQLVRYMKCIKDKENPKIKELTVVYLTLRADKDVPDPASYNSSKYDAEIQALKMNNILKCISAVAPTKDVKHSLVNGFLENCLEYVEKKNTENNSVVKVFINQYIILLNHLGGDAYMKKINKDLIDEIYKSKELYETIDSIANFWNKKEKERTQIVIELIKEKVEDDVNLSKNPLLREFYWNGEKWPVTCWKTDDSELFIYFYEGVNFGFVSEKEIQDAQIEKFIPLNKTFKSATKHEHIDNVKEDNWYYWEIKDYCSRTVIEDTLNSLNYLLEQCYKEHS